MTIETAARIAFIAMGTEVKRVGKWGRGRLKVHRADEDPLAWWCLTELIFDAARRAKR